MPTPNKTHRTAASVAAFIAQHPKEQMRADSHTLIALTKALSGEKPDMYGPSIIGFGTCHYTFPSGHTGSSP